MEQHDLQLSLLHLFSGGDWFCLEVLWLNPLRILRRKNDWAVTLPMSTVVRRDLRIEHSCLPSVRLAIERMVGLQGAVMCWPVALKQV